MIIPSRLISILLPFHITCICVFIALVWIFGSDDEAHVVAMSTMTNLGRRAVLITGSTDGIGVTTAKNLATIKESPYTDIIIHGRNEDRIRKAKDIIERFMDGTQKVNNDARTNVWALPPTDLSTIHGSRMVASHVQKLCEDENLQLTCIMNNAGVFSQSRTITDDGLELTFAVNVVSMFVLTSLLLPTMLLSQEQHQRRIVIASSISQCRAINDWDDLSYTKRPYSAHTAYSESKLLDAMLTMEFAERLKQAGYTTKHITCNCLDPGTVNTKMLLAGWGPCGINVNDALDETWLCSSSDVAAVTGRYFVYQNDSKASLSAYDIQQRSKLWSILSDLAPDASSVWNFDWINAKEAIKNKVPSDLI